MVMNPMTTQAAMSSAGELTSRAISAETMKMPEPIMEPMTSVVELVRPRPLIHSLSPVLDTVFVSVAKEPRVGGEGARKNLHHEAQEFLSNFGWRTQ